MKVAVVILIAFFVFMTPHAVAQTQVVYSNEVESLMDYSIGLGSTIAVVVSWSRNKSIALAILHGIFGWCYLVYYVITYNNIPNNS